MPDRLNTVTIELSHNTVTLSFDSRNLLLERLEGVDGLEDVVKAFRGAGASSPVRIKPEDREPLHSAIYAWAKTTDHLPAGVKELRAMLMRDITDDAL